MVPRFFLADLDGSRGRATLSREESHHLVRVMRLVPGAEVRVFDGRGGEWRACVRVAATTGVELDIHESVTPAPEFPAQIVLAQAALKGDRMDAVFRDATMMGVAAILPISTAHTAVPARALGASAVERWRRIAIASAKQCGRAVVPRVSPATRFLDFLRAGTPGVRLILTEPRSAAVSGTRVDGLRQEARQSGAVVVVGPEGGWSAEEVAAAVEAGFQCWSLGTMTLRADAVPVAALAVLRYAWGE